MEGIAFIPNAWKEGVISTMKNFFLYMTATNKESYSEKLKNVYYFSNEKILAVDKNMYNKSERFKMQNELEIKPFSITQRIFKALLKHIVDSPKKIIIKHIEFIDESISDSQEYLELCNLIGVFDDENIFKQVDYILHEFDTEIYSIAIRYSGYDFLITAEGVIDTDAPDNILTDFFVDEAVNDLLLV